MDFDDFLDSMDTEDIDDNNNCLTHANKKKVTNIPLFERNIGDVDYQIAINDMLIPRNYDKAKYDSERIKANIVNELQAYGGMYKFHNFNKYASVCETILSIIRSGDVPNFSIIIGAPDGLGKTSLVTECIVNMMRNGLRVVPYVSLLEVAQIRVSEEQRLMKPFNSNREPVTVEDNIKKPELISQRYSWSEYVNADCLFVYFSSILSKEIESYTLQQLLKLRGTKGLPTIVMMSTSLDPYTNDKTLKEYVWNDILITTMREDCYDKVSHISCYKIKRGDEELED